MVLRPSEGEGSRATARDCMKPLAGFAEQSPASHIAENGCKYLDMADIS